MAVARIWICVTATVTSAARTLLSRWLRFCEQPPGGLGVADGGGRGEPEYEGQVEGVGADGEGFGEDAVDAEPQRGWASRLSSASASARSSGHWPVQIVPAPELGRTTVWLTAEPEP